MIQGEARSGQSLEEASVSVEDHRDMVIGGLDWVEESHFSR